MSFILGVPGAAREHIASKRDHADPTVTDFDLALETLDSIFQRITDLCFAIAPDALTPSEISDELYKIMDDPG